MNCGHKRLIILYGGIPKWLKGADCKSVGSAFDGSNPSPSTKLAVNHLIAGWLLLFFKLILKSKWYSYKLRVPFINVSNIQFFLSNLIHFSISMVN